MSKLAKFYILLVAITGGGLLLWNLRYLGGVDLLLVLGMCVITSLTLIVKVTGATESSHFNISLVIYSFSLVLLGVPETVVVIVVSLLADWIWHRYLYYIQLFNISQFIIAAQICGWVYQSINPSGSLLELWAVPSILIVLALFTLLNHLFIGLVIWAARGENFKKSGIFAIFSTLLDFTLMSLGAGMAIIWTMNPYAVILVVIPLYLIYNTLKVPSLERKSEVDSKTGLFNARYFTKALKNELSRANRMSRPLVVVMADLDLLRNINNTYGHLAGDQVLIGVANILREHVRDYDVVARFGGEEFAILMPEISSEEAYERVEELRKLVENASYEVETSIEPIKATLSFGIAEKVHAHQDEKALVHEADLALYRAKLSGRNRTEMYLGEKDLPALFEDDPEIIAPNTASFEARLQMAERQFFPSELRGSVNAEPTELTQESEQKKIQVGNHQPKPGWMINTYIVGLTAIAVGLFAVFYRPFNVLDWVGLGIFFVAVLLMEWLSVDIYIRETSVSTSAVPLVAGILIFGPVGALVLSFAVSLGALIKHRNPFNRLLFNASNQMIPGLLFLGVLSLIGESFFMLPILVQVLLALGLAMVLFLFTTYFVSVAISMTRGEAVLPIWKNHFSWLAPYYLIMGLVAYTFIFSYVVADVIGLVIMITPLFVLRYSQEQYIHRTKENVHELRRKNIALEKSLEENHQHNQELLFVLAEVIDLRDPYVLDHSKHVSRYATLIAEELGLNTQQIEMIRKAGLLHDIGKIGIPEHILFKPTSLTGAEYEVIKKHSRYGADIIIKSNSLKELVPAVLHHHERFDGMGYPDRLKDGEIPIEARILALADAIEAMVSDRPYRIGMNAEEILEEICAHKGTQFDPRVVEAFVRVLKGNEKALINSTREKPMERVPTL